MHRYETWVERQIREAQERGEFDNLPGAGRPLPGLTGRDDADWWVKGLIEREQLRPPLPPALALRKEVEDLPRTVRDVADEATVRAIAEDLNRRILQARRSLVDGPRVLVPSVDVEEVLAGWRRSRGQD